MLISHFRTEPENRGDAFNKLWAEYITILENKKFT